VQRPEAAAINQRWHEEVVERGIRT